MKTLDQFLMEAGSPPPEMPYRDRRKWHMSWGDYGKAVAAAVPWWMPVLLPTAVSGIAFIAIVGALINLTVQFLALTLDGVEALSDKTWYSIAHYIWKHSKEGKEWIASEKQSEEEYQARLRDIQQKLKAQTAAAIRARQARKEARIKQKVALAKLGKKPKS